MFAGCVFGFSSGVINWVNWPINICPFLSVIQKIGTLQWCGLSYLGYLCTLSIIKYRFFFLFVFLTNPLNKRNCTIVFKNKISFRWHHSNMYCLQNMNERTLKKSHFHRVFYENKIILISCIRIVTPHITRKYPYIYVFWF